MFFLPLWLVLAFLTGLASNAHNFLSRYVLKDGDDATAYAWYFELGNAIIFFILLFFNWHLVLTLQSSILFLLLGLSEFISIYFYMKMHAYTHLSISAILSRTRMIWVPILAFFFIAEQLQFTDYLGIAIIFIGVSITSAPHKLFIDKGAMYANLAAFTIAANIIITHTLLPYGSNAVINFARCLPAVILFPLLMKNSPTRIKAVLKTQQKARFAAVIFSALSVLLFIMALRVGDASKINAIYQGMMIFSVLAGIIFLKERKDITRKLFGAVITIVGVVILSIW